MTEWKFRRRKLEKWVKNWVWATLWAFSLKESSWSCLWETRPRAGYKCISKDTGGWQFSSGCLKEWLLLMLQKWFVDNLITVFWVVSFFIINLCISEVFLMEYHVRVLKCRVNLIHINWFSKYLPVLCALKIFNRISTMGRPILCLRSLDNLWQTYNVGVYTLTKWHRPTISATATKWKHIKRHLNWDFKLGMM